MRRLGILILAAAALFAGACGGSDKKSATNAGESANASSGLDKVAAGAAVKDVCGGKAALGVGAAFSQAAASNNGTVDYSDVAAGLRKAASGAPEEIKADFTILADALGPYLQTFEDAKGDYMALAQDPAFVEASKKLAASEYTEAARRVNAWFTDHCK